MSGEAEEFSPLRWRAGALELLDQTRLPHEETWLRCERPEEVADAIRRLAVRGAPAIGVAAAYGLVLGVKASEDGSHPAADFERTARLLQATRPTAVNLKWAIDRARELVAARAGESRAALGAALLAWAQRVQEEDVAANRRIGEYGRELFQAGDRVLTHCNAGALATAGIGTAVGVIAAAAAAGRIDLVYVDETRPLLQGARLTAWEMQRLGIPYRLVTDSSVGALMSRGLVSRVVVGADRIARNGDTANKIGTYTVAVLAQRHAVPFYVAAPLSTFDPATDSGAEIPIEERAAAEVTTLHGATISPEGAPALNFAFDVTPAELIAAHITDRGVLYPPYRDAIARVLGLAAT